MTCKDCYHYEVCSKKDGTTNYYGKIGACNYVDEMCKHFKDKSLIVKLPNIEIGQELFYIDRYGKQVKSDTVSKLTFEKNDLGIDTGVWSDNYGFSEFFSDVGKTLFLTKEEAEAKLKELNGND